MIQVEALCRQIYNGRSYITGDLFEVQTESEVSDMEALHIARRSKKQESRTHVADTTTREMVSMQDQPDAAAQQGQGRYARRDMRARR